MFKHIRDNKGDANVSKITMVAIVFVVGAILLVLTTSAFRNPINRWFEKVTTGWFASENGMYEADNPFLGYEKNANGTYKGVEYRWTNPDGSYAVVQDVDNAELGGEGMFVIKFYNAQGYHTMLEVYEANTSSVSIDGKTLYLDNEEFYATQP